jgi:aryl-alcohol dehydrogenase-like predicted oxidoreductase
MTAAASRLALGTVQFGLDYGVTHGGGRIPESEMNAILARARKAGIDLLDTAAAYGDAEDVLGRSDAGQAFRIVTKTLPFAAAGNGAGAMARVKARFLESLDRLAVPAVDGLLVHAASDLMSPDGLHLWRQLESWRSQGLARRIGVSVYDRAEIDSVLAHFSPDLVQLPLNVLDQRLLSDGTIARLVDQGIAIHVRSLFLQGLLLQSPAECPPHLAATRPFLDRWWTMCREHGVPPLTAALRFGLNLPGIEKLVVGVHSDTHLDAILTASLADCSDLDWDALAAHDCDAVDPRRWPKA